MMLHEAVMLEIYRQALTASELSSPRCLSRDSSVGGRCPSDESIYSGRGMSGSNATSPVAITLPATLPPAAAAALLPPQSAAMAAYLGVAAAAAQQNRLLFNSSLTAGLTRVGSPPLLLASHLDSDTSVLDFSTKRSTKGGSDSRESDSDAVNLSNKADNGPLDLSVNRKRNAESHSPQMPSRKQARAIDYKPVVSPWTSPVTPYFAAAVAAASISPKNHTTAAEWASAKGKMSSAPNDATKALEKMSELSRLGGEDIYKQHGGSLSREVNAVSSGGSSGGGRHSAWQSHWLNKGADSAKDVLKCVWCKQSFPSLAAMTTHMKETKHCGVNVPPAGGMSQVQPHPPIPTSSSSSGSSSSSKPSASDLNLLIKETMPLPRKLVRGQDVWLGKGAEQTRQILKCMWCGQSFRSLAEMTSHMQQTQHYTNIISQEQIISWKSSEDGKTPTGPGNPNSSSANQNAGPNSTVSAVLTCKVCDQAFSSLKDLSNHMVKNAHYKEHIMRSITESGGRRRQTREKRKKSLPVRKLLELERAQHDFKNGESNLMSKTMREAASGRITCEKCGDKIDTVLFVEHIRQCVGGVSINSHRVKPPSLSGANSILPPSESVSPLTPGSRDGRKSIGDEIPSPASRHISPNAADLSSPKESSHDKTSSSPSVLNAIEQLIEKSFDTRSRHSTGIQGPNQNAAPLGSSILKRLGIDESVDYTKPLIDHQTMNLLRSYQQQQVYGRRERSGSESSSFSDRGSSRVDSLTPERKVDPPLQSSTPRHTPEKQEAEDLSETSVKIKREPDDEEKREGTPGATIAIKKEAEDVDDTRPKSRAGDSEADADGGKLRSSSLSSPMPSPRHTPVTPAASPGSDRSTPRSQVNASETKKPSSAGGSLGALSSMFDNLTGGGGANPPTSEGGGSGKKGSSHPLAALQKLCDKTETNQNSRTNSASSNSSLASSNTGVSTSATAPGAILAFSWACNDAVMTSDSIMKCAFCDTPFISKGAYRHHLSKMHFVKDDVIPDPIAVKGQKQIPPQTSQSSPKGSSAVSSGNGVAPSGSREGTSTGPASTSNSASVPTKSPPPSGVSFEESPHSKFLKYTELAKQLSSKYV